jgi:hypothetical protein
MSEAEREPFTQTDDEAAKETLKNPVAGAGIG